MPPRVEAPGRDLRALLAGVASAVCINNQPASPPHGGDYTSEYEKAPRPRVDCSREALTMGAAEQDVYRLRVVYHATP